MPGKDGTGPLGQGSMTGKQMGICATNVAQEPVTNEPIRPGMGMAWGRGGSMGCGLAHRIGRGGAFRGQGGRMRQA